jgi:selenide, water dikinase
MATPPTPNLILLGGGHAHLHVLESLASTEWPPVRPILISPRARQFYSGMIPGYLQGQYSEAQLSIDLAGLCRAAGAEFVEAAALRVDPDAREVHTVAGTFRFSLLSLDIGSAPGGLELPGVRDHAVPLRPLSAVVALRRRFDQLVRERSPSGTPVRIAVVGAGAGGIEIALALQRRAPDCGGGAAVLLVDGGSQILTDYSGRAQEKIRRILRERGIELMLEREVVAVSPEAICVAEGERISADLVIWATGATPPPLLDASPLPRSEAGYLSVDSTLRAVDGSRIWGAGDCVGLAGHDLPKAGVFAVREGPVIAHNLRAALADDAPREYRPQSSYLSILNTADGQALLRWRALVVHSRLAWRLKDRIDRAFVRRFAVLARR